MIKWFIIMHKKKLQSVVPWFKKKLSNTRMGLHDLATSDSWLDKFKTNDQEHNIAADKWAQGQRNLTHSLTTLPPPP